MGERQPSKSGRSMESAICRNLPDVWGGWADLGSRWRLIAPVLPPRCDWLSLTSARPGHRIASVVLVVITAAGGGIRIGSPRLMANDRQRHIHVDRQDTAHASIYRADRSGEFGCHNGGLGSRACTEHAGLGLKTTAIARHARLHGEDLGSTSTSAAGQRGGSSHIQGSRSPASYPVL